MFDRKEHFIKLTNTYQNTVSSILNETDNHFVVIATADVSMIEDLGSDLVKELDTPRYDTLKKIGLHILNTHYQESPSDILEWLPEHILEAGLPLDFISYIMVHSQGTSQHWYNTDQLTDDVNEELESLMHLRLTHVLLRRFILKYAKYEPSISHEEDLLGKESEFRTILKIKAPGNNTYYDRSIYDQFKDRTIGELYYLMFDYQGTVFIRHSGKIVQHDVFREMLKPKAFEDLVNNLLRAGRIKLNIDLTECRSFFTPYEDVREALDLL